MRSYYARTVSFRLFPQTTAHYFVVPVAYIQKSTIFLNQP